MTPAGHPRAMGGDRRGRRASGPSTSGPRWCTSEPGDDAPRGTLPTSRSSGGGEVTMPALILAFIDVVIVTWALICAERATFDEAHEEVRFR